MSDQYIKAGWYRAIRSDGSHLYYRDRWGEREEQTSSPRLVELGKFRPPSERGRWLSRHWKAGVVGVFDGPGAVAVGVPTVFLETVQKIRHEENWKDLRDLDDKAFKKRIYMRLETEDLHQYLGFQEGAEHEKLYKNAIRRLGTCGQVLGEKVCADCPPSERAGRKVHKTFCGLYHLCPTCARIRSNALRRALERHVKTVKKVKGYSWKMLTLTVRTEPGRWESALRVCVDSFAKVWRMHLKAEGAGAFRAVEFGPLNGNIHVHVLYYGPWVKMSEVAPAWERYTGGSYVCEVHAIKDKKTGKLAEDEYNMEKAIAECAKYTTKMSEVEADELVRFWASIRGSHTTQRYGVLRGISTEKQIFETPMCEVCGCTEFFYFYNDPGFSKEERGP